ncbi:MAG: hypothetical protein HUJ68_01955 [Clostridia bacterium]|nr:hypothetical protein [Clostridia bacterium]
MAITKMTIKKGLKAELDNHKLDEGELGFTTDEKKVYVGTAEGNVLVGPKTEELLTITLPLSDDVSYYERNLDSLFGRVMSIDANTSSKVYYGSTSNTNYNEDKNNNITPPIGIVVGFTDDNVELQYFGTVVKIPYIGENGSKPRLGQYAVSGKDGFLYTCSMSNNRFTREEDLNYYTGFLITKTYNATNDEKNAIPGLTGYVDVFISPANKIGF